MKFQIVWDEISSYHNLFSKRYVLIDLIRMQSFFYSAHLWPSFPKDTLFLSLIHFILLFLVTGRIFVASVALTSSAVCTIPLPYTSFRRTAVYPLSVLSSKYTGARREWASGKGQKMFTRVASSFRAQAKFLTILLAFSRGHAAKNSLRSRARKRSIAKSRHACMVSYSFRLPLFQKRYPISP